MILQTIHRQLDFIRLILRRREMIGRFRHWQAVPGDTEIIELREMIGADDLSLSYLDDPAPNIWDRRDNEEWELARLLALEQRADAILDADPWFAAWLRANAFALNGETRVWDSAFEHLCEVFGSPPEQVTALLAAIDSNFRRRMDLWRGMTPPLERGDCAGIGWIANEMKLAMERRSNEKRKW
jgi:hypothetical protein